MVAADNSYIDGSVEGTGRWVQTNLGFPRMENGQRPPALIRAGAVAKEDEDFPATRDSRTGYGNLNIVNAQAWLSLRMDKAAQTVIAPATIIQSPST